jgi:hypothetical protein
MVSPKGDLMNLFRLIRRLFFPAPASPVIRTEWESIPYKFEVDWFVAPRSTLGDADACNNAIWRASKIVKLRRLPEDRCHVVDS